MRAWLECRNLPAAFQPPAPPRDAQAAIRAWNMMRGLDWQALDTVCELIGIEDVERVVALLCVIRDSETETEDD